MSRVRRLLVTDRIFFVTANLRRNLAALAEDEFPLVLASMEESRQKLGFRLCGYVLMPDHWHALIGVEHPLVISRAVQDVKWISARRINRRRGSGPGLAAPVLGPLCPARKGIHGKAGVHAPQPGQQESGEAS